MMETPPAEATDEPVSVLVRRRIAAGREEEFKAWADEMNALSRQWAGYVGANVIAPAPGAKSRDYVVLFRFDTDAHRQAWETSGAYRAALERATAFTDGSVQTSTISGLAPWVNLPGAPITPVWKMVLVLGVAIYPVATGLGLLTHPFVRDLPPWLASLISLILTLVIVSYLVLPWLTRLLAGWLQDATTPDRRGKRPSAG